MSDKPDEKYQLNLSLDDDKFTDPSLPSSDLPKRRKRTDPTRVDRVQTRSQKVPAQNSTDYSSEIASDSEYEELSESSEDEMSLKKPFDVPIFDGLESEDSAVFKGWYGLIKNYLIILDLWTDPKIDETALATLHEKKPSDMSKAFAHIYGHLHRDIAMAMEIETGRCPILALRYLKSKYDADSTVNKLSLVIRSFEKRFAYGDGSLREHVDSLLKNYNCLNSLGGIKAEMLPVLNLIISLPREFDGILAPFLKDEQSLTFNAVAKAVLDEEKRWKMRERATTSQPQPRDGSALRVFQAKSKKLCNYCKKPNHDAKVCRSRLFDERNKRQESSQHHYKSKPMNSSRPHARALFSTGEQEDENAEHDSSMFTQEDFAYSAREVYSVVQPPRKLQKKAPNRFVQPREVTHEMKLARDFNRALKTDKGFRGSGLSVTINQQIPEKLGEGSSEMYNQDDDLPPTPGKNIEELIEKEIDETSPSGSVRSNSSLSINEENSKFDYNKGLEMYSNCFLVGTDHTDKWILDSGASSHFCKSRHLFLDFRTVNGWKIKIADGSFLKVTGLGTIRLLIKTPDKPIALFLKNVRYVPSLHTNLVSVNCLTAEDCSIMFNKTGAQIKIGDEYCHLAEFKNNCFAITEDYCHEASLCIDELHKRFAHRNLEDIRRQKQFGLKISKCACNHHCEPCSLAKFTELSFPKVSEKPDKPLDIIVADVCGRIQYETPGKKVYFLTLTDVFSDYTEVFFLRQKSEAKQHVINFVEMTKNQLGNKMKIFRTDRGLEFLDSELTNYLTREGIKLQWTSPNSPAQNGISERKNRTLNDAVRTLLISSKLPKTLWAEAMQNVVYTQNRIVRKNKDHAPIELFFGKKFNGIFLEFGCDVYVMTKKDSRKKYDPHSTLVKFLSVDDHTKGFRLWTGNKVIVDRNVRLQKKTISYKSFEGHKIDSPKSSEHETEAILTPSSVKTNIVPSQSEEPSTKSAPRRSKRIAKLRETAMAATAPEDPKTYKQALESVDSECWIKAMNEEIDALKSTNTIELVDPNAAYKAPIGCRWVFKKKNEIMGQRYKARLVAQGYSQVYGDDFDECFAPVVRSASIRLLLSMAGTRKMTVKQFDVQTAFLNGDLDEEIFMKLPPGMNIENKIIRLRKALYGLKQSANAWHKKLVTALFKIGFEKSKEDKCFFILKNGTERCYLVSHVDDLICSATSPSLVAQVFNELSKEFTMKDLGVATQFLNVDMTRDSEGHFSINQSKYIENIAREFQLLNAKSQKYPISPGYYSEDCEDFLESNKEYRKMIGMLLYVATNTRPDVSAAVCILSQRVEKPRLIDFTETRRVIKYLMSTKDYELKLSDSSKIQALNSYSDANWGQCKLSGKSNTGMVCFVNGGAIVWRCQKQTFVAQSTYEAEYYAAAETIRETLWLIAMLKDFEVSFPNPILIKIDNQACISMLINGEFSQRTKYIGVKCHYINDWIQKKRIALSYVESEHNVSDLLTKPLPAERIKALTKAIGLYNSNNSELRELLS